MDQFRGRSIGNRKKKKEKGHDIEKGEIEIKIEMADPGQETTRGHQLDSHFIGASRVYVPTDTHNYT